MSEARWCDYGDHAYAGGRPGTIMMGQLKMVAGPGNAGNSIQQNVKEMCPECAAELGLITDYEAPLPPSERRAAILSGVKGKHTKVTE